MTAPQPESNASDGDHLGDLRVGEFDKAERDDDDGTAVTTATGSVRHPG